MKAANVSSSFGISIRPGGKKDGVPAVEEDHEAIIRSLSLAGVLSQNVYLVCIEEELEAWLIADGRAISAMLSTPSHPIKVPDVKRPEQIYNPKGRLKRIFPQHSGSPYNDRVHAGRIVRALPDLNRLKRCAAFIRFVIKVTGEIP